MSTDNKELVRLFFSKPLLMEVRNPIWEEFRAKTRMKWEQYQRDKEAMFPSWMDEKTALTQIGILKN